jgi:hypothetical protein
VRADAFGRTFGLEVWRIPRGNLRNPVGITIAKNCSPDQRLQLPPAVADRPDAARRECPLVVTCRCRTIIFYQPSGSPASASLLIFVSRLASSSLTCGGGCGFIPAPRNCNPHPRNAARRDDPRAHRIASTEIPTTSNTKAKTTMTGTSLSIQTRHVTVSNNDGGVRLHHLQASSMKN